MVHGGQFDAPNGSGPWPNADTRRAGFKQVQTGARHAAIGQVPAGQGLVTNDGQALFAGPAELVATARVARRYYLDNRSRGQISAELGITRPEVLRLLELSHASGMVRITVTDAGGALKRCGTEGQVGLGVRWGWGSGCLGVWCSSSHPGGYGWQDGDGHYR